MVEQFWASSRVPLRLQLLLVLHLLPLPSNPSATSIMCCLWDSSIPQVVTKRRDGVIHPTGALASSEVSRSKLCLGAPTLLALMLFEVWDAAHVLPPYFRPPFIGALCMLVVLTVSGHSLCASLLRLFVTSTASLYVLQCCFVVVSDFSWWIRLPLCSVNSGIPLCPKEV